MNKNNHYSRGMLFLDPPQGNNEGGGGGAGGQQPPAQNQQQAPPAQNQQQQSPPDPWAGMDLDMLPDHVRTAVETSRTTLQQLQTQAAQGQTAQQTAQQLQQQVETMRQQILRNQSQNPTPPQSNQGPPSMDAQLEAYYIEQGIPAEQAKKVTAMNKGAFEIFGRHFQQQIGAQLAPITNRVVEDSAQEAFAGAIQNDRVGWSQNDEIKQALWDRTTAMAEQGQIVSPAVVSNLAKIFYYDYLEKGGQTPPNIVPINQPHTIPNMTQGFQPLQNTRFSYPGAGNVPMTRHTSNNQQSQLDPETAAALAATTGNWSQPLQSVLKQKQAGGR